MKMATYGEVLPDGSVLNHGHLARYRSNFKNLSPNSTTTLLHRYQLKVEAHHVINV